MEVCASGLMVRLEMESTEPIQTLLLRAQAAGISVRAEETTRKGAACLLLASAGVPIEAFGAAMACLQSAIEEEQPFHTGKETP